MSTKYLTSYTRTQQEEARKKFRTLFEPPQLQDHKPREVLCIHRIKMRGQARDKELFVVSRRDSIDPSVAPLGVYRFELTKRNSKDTRRRIKNAFRRVFGEHIEWKSFLGLCDYSKAETFENYTSLKQLGEVRS